MIVGRIYSDPRRTRVSLGTGGMFWLTAVATFVATTPYASHRPVPMLLWAPIALLAAGMGVMAWISWRNLPANERPPKRIWILAAFAVILVTGPAIFSAMGNLERNGNLFNDDAAETRPDVAQLLQRAEATGAPPEVLQRLRASANDMPPEMVEQMIHDIERRPR